ncbi:hypothetical protein, partial [Flavobacterium sp.]|uniref:hypothetical protein n=1 Tax=Flavobacterium sp. TaxID=239 RepID=UPI0025B97745
MKEIYFKSINNKLHYLFILLALFTGNLFTAEAQVKKVPTQRTSTYSPTKKIYNIQGDFTMLGNTNLTPQSYNNTVNNNSSTMQYVDIDGDPNTWNSSSSTLALSTENGAVPSCSNIIYAGLYWTGKSSANSTFTATKNIPTGNNISVPVALSNARIYNSTNVITQTNYTLTVTRSGLNNNRTIIYDFTSSVSGNPNVKFIYKYDNATSTGTLFKSINNGTETSVAVSSIDSNNAYLDTPYEIFSDSNYTLKLNRLRRDGNNSNVNSPTSAYVDISYVDIITETITVSKTFDKRKISLKGPGETSYTSITANANDIYYPSGTDDDIYSAYAEVTDYVKSHGVGAYFAADMALLEGNPGGTGYSGGWGMIVIYENSKMKYRDVTIFDGYAYVQASNTSGFTLPVSGFNTVQSGAVEMKLGLMASEGDVNFTGDYFQIQKVSDASYMNLNHSGNSATNFFNSSIIVGGARNPSLQNNTGVDFSMFTIPNVGNSVIANNQTSVNFKFGTDGDTYSIFAIAMAVDAYVPVAEAVIATQTLNGATVYGSITSVNPGDEIGAKINIYNKGTEAVNNAKFIIPIPYTLDFVAGSLTKNVNFSPLPSPNNYYFDPTLGPKGSIVYDLGTLPLPADPSTILGDFSFKVKVTTDCAILKNSLCNQNVSIYGNISGTGATTAINFTEKPFYVGYNSTGVCQGEPILNPLNISINSSAYVNQNCIDTPNTREFVFCTPDSTIPVTAISSGFPSGSKYYNEYPIVSGTTEYTISNPFPATLGSASYYAVPPGASDSCSFPFTIKVTNVTTVPNATTAIEYCQGATASPLTATATNPAYTLYYYNSLTGTAQLELTPSTASAGSTTYYVAEAASGSCIGPKKAIVVTVNPMPIAPTVLCYQTATFNTTTCAWDVTGTQPVKPALACYESATFNTETCAWDVTGTQPVKPTLACYESATFNTETCVWDVTGTQPVKPALACYESATFNTTTCVWDVTGTQPVKPTLACYESATFNTETCVWDVT